MFSKLALIIVAVAALGACQDQSQNPKPAPLPTAPTPTATKESTASPTLGNTNGTGGSATQPPAGQPGPATTGAAPSATGTGAKLDPSAEAEQIFSQRCSVCHGMSGKGDGVGSAALNPKPRNYTDPKWQASVNDEHIAKTIVEGGAAVGLSPLMAPNPDLKDKPEVVKALVAKVRSFKGK